MLGVLSIYGLGDYKTVLSFFESSAASSDWNMRELAQMFFRKLIKKYHDEMKKYLLNLVKKEPVKVMDLLEVDEYKYKKRIYKRIEHKGN